MCTSCEPFFIHFIFLFILRFRLSAVDVNFNCCTFSVCMRMCVFFLIRKRELIHRCASHKYLMHFNFIIAKKNEKLCWIWFFCCCEFFFNYIFGFWFRLVSTSKMCCRHKLCINSSLTSVRKMRCAFQKCRFVPILTNLSPPRKNTIEHKMENKLVNEWMKTHSHKFTQKEKKRCTTFSNCIVPISCKRVHANT